MELHLPALKNDNKESDYENGIVSKLESAFSLSDHICLNTFKPIVRTQWTVLPIPQVLVKLAKTIKLATVAFKSPLCKTHSLIFLAPQLSTFSM